MSASRAELTEVIANVERERLGTAMQSGNAAACILALRALQELQAIEKKALAMQGPSAVHSANLATLAAEIARVQKLAGSTKRVTLASTSKAVCRRPAAPLASVASDGRKTRGGTHER